MCIRDSVNAICQEIKAKYEYADADYMVVVPDGILDIITEGRALHHCAGRRLAMKKLLQS